MTLWKTSTIRTTGWVASAAPLAALADGWACMASAAAAPGFTVAVNVTGVRLPTWAERWLVPAVPLRVQLPTVAMPEPLVSTLPLLTVPSPAVAVKVTVAPATGLPLTSTTRTEGAGATAVPAVPVSVVLEAADTVAGAPASTWMAPEDRATSPVAVKLRVRVPTVPVMARLVKVTTPLALLATVVVPPRVPPPATIAAVTWTPAWVALFPNWSLSWMMGCCARAAPLSALLPGAVLNTMLAGAPATAVAVMVTGASVPTVAVRVLAPTCVPSVQLPTAATPLASVVSTAPVSAPPPEATANVTWIPGTPRPFLSRTWTEGATATAVATGACWLLPDSAVTLVGV
ncbi:MAG: hypothetical protein IPF77_08915 [Gemmatimonadetes bacterium]|nr:hypothetical protein [Gemmatimonadota bacterium]